jgi:hypothetical protein
MQRFRFCWLGIVLTAVVATGASAQDRLASVVVKETLSREDLAIIKTEVGERVKALTRAGTNDKRRAQARGRILRTARVSGASPAGLAAYASECAEELEPLTTAEAFQTGFDAVRILIELDNGNTSGTLAAALKSAHAPVRYLAARGIRNLHKQLKDDREKCRVVLRALGDCGASERDGVVLRMIYEAIHFHSDVSDFAFGDACAGALNKVFAARILELLQGSRDEMVDEPGFAVAADCYAAARDTDKRRLIAYMAAFLSHGVGRYFDASTAPEFLPSLERLIGQAEETVHGMIRASSGQVPGKKFSEELTRRASEDEKWTAVQAAWDSLFAVLRGDPWNLTEADVQRPRLR